MEGMRGSVLEEGVYDDRRAFTSFVILILPFFIDFKGHDAPEVNLRINNHYLYLFDLFDNYLSTSKGMAPQWSISGRKSRLGFVGFTRPCFSCTVTAPPTPPAPPHLAPRSFPVNAPCP
jgi:hypothetical protein